MDRRSKLVAVAALLLCASAHAGYALPSPPPGFGGSSGSWTMSPAANAPTVGGGPPASNSPVFKAPGPRMPGVPGVPAVGGAYRLGGGAARALAGGIARGLLGPVGLAAGLAWMAKDCIERKNGAWVLTCGPGVPSYPQSTGNEFKTQGWNATDEWFMTYDAACSAATAYLNGVGSNGNTYSTHTCTRQRYSMNLHTPSGTVYQDYQGVPMLERADTCPTGWYKTPAGCMASPPPVQVTPEQIEDIMAPKPLPNPLPGDFPYPLDPEAPFIFNPTPGDNPQSQPWRVPQGNPVPIPNTNPQQYRQPVTRFTSAPTPSEPFRVDSRPEEIVGQSPQGLQQPETVTSGSPAGDKPEQFDLCKEHPDIIACQVFKPDELAPQPVPNKEVPLALNAEGGFPTGGSCPQPKVVQLMGKTFAFSMQPLCDFATGIKPLLIGFAWLSAALVFLGVARREG